MEMAISEEQKNDTDPVDNTMTLKTLFWFLVAICILDKRAGWSMYSGFNAQARWITAKIDAS